MTTSTPEDLTHDPESPRFEKGKKLYECWQNAGGALSDVTLDHRPFERIPPGDQSRWMWLAKAVGDPAHDFIMAEPADVAKFGSSITEPVELYDYDNVMKETGRDSGGCKLAGIDGDFTSIPENYPTYPEWCKMLLTSADVRRHWWQFWLTPPASIDTTSRAYLDQYWAWRDSFRDRAGSRII